eukprot:TRINITY_DN4245_c0_g1_i1.p1 TRINITY_DN4245_c0_g1~~TRINITY_DN4245_c0_g1_i1.p1  ORF type:complete len:323 (+),score=83.60 TRINITY_DN4245_c0_g1_i1:67-1035(+)
MKSLLLLALVAAASGQRLTAAYVEENHHALWGAFKTTYTRSYTAAEEAHRRSVFKANLLEAAALQARSTTAEYGVTKFSDLTEEEFRASYTGLMPTATPPQDIPRVLKDDEVNATVPSKDWREDGAVTAVKTQGKCGSCWSFASTGAIEAGNVIAGSKLTSLSEQQLVSCSKGYCQGCRGGIPKYAYEWLLEKNAGQIVTEEAYPYEGEDSPCKDFSAMPVGATIKNWTALPHNEDQMAAWVASRGPISISVGCAMWRFYKGGVMDHCHAMPDHAVLIVGVTPDYWLIKNSWGADWGEAGYIRLKYGDNECYLTGRPETPLF